MQLKNYLISVLSLILSYSLSAILVSVVLFIATVHSDSPANYMPIIAIGVVLVGVPISVPTWLILRWIVKKDKDVSAIVKRYLLR